jgi:predicted HTH domain antitoxin
MYVDINFKVPEEILLTLRENKDNFVIEMKRSAATNYFLNKKLSIGQCAELAEMSEADFIKYLSNQKISIFNFDSEDELLEDIKNA